MAWENAIIENLTTGTVSGDLASWSAYHDPMTGTTAPAVSDSPFANFSGGISYTAQQLYAANDGDFIFGDEQAGLRCKSSGTLHHLYMWYNGEQVSDYMDVTARPAYSDYPYYGRTIFVLTNDETQTGTLILMTRSWNGRWNSTAESYGLTWNVYKTQTAVVYNWAKRLAPPPAYTWQSVPNIAGKGKTIQLPQIITTDGNPVTSGSASDFSILPTEAIVKTLADANVE